LGLLRDLPWQVLPCLRWQVAARRQGWKESLNGKDWELTTWFRVTCWRNLAEAVNQYLEKGSQVFVEGELRGDASDGSQNPRIWQGNDGQSGDYREHQAGYELTARTVTPRAWASAKGAEERPSVSRRRRGTRTIRFPSRCDSPNN
jgi:single-strand DNA-binding protein